MFYGQPWNENSSVHSISANNPTMQCSTFYSTADGDDTKARYLKSYMAPIDGITNDALILHCMLTVQSIDSGAVLSPLTMYVNILEV